MPPFSLRIQTHMKANLEMQPTLKWANDQRGDLKPMELIGAGPLLSTIWKLGGEHTSGRYRCSIVRQTSGIVSDLFLPTDLIHFVKLIQVLATVIADDGCLTQTERTTLRNLSAQLDDFLGNANVEADEHAARAT